MIVEIAAIRVKPGSEAEFEAAVHAAVAVFARAEGCLGLHLEHCIEAPDEYRVVIHWETLEAHTVTFRESPLFAEWRALVGPHFAEPPQVKHFTVAMTPTGF